MGRSMLSRLVDVLLVLAASGTMAFAADTPVRLVPAPQQVRWSERAPLPLPADQVAIVIGAKATEPEQYAADTLRKTVAKRFKVEWPIVTAAGDRKRYAVELLLGQRSTHGELDDVCSKMNIDLSEKSPGHDGYVVECVQADGRNIVVVGGSNPRAVIYGQDTLFQMITRKGDGLAMVQAAIRDWPLIPWRGRPETTMQHYFRADELDCYAASRINFIDLREGIYATEPGEKLNPDLVKRTVTEARKRGFIVFAIVNCAAKKDKYEAVLGSFKESIEMGATGLWLSFDDKGPGEDPVKLVTQVLALGREHGITGAQIAVTPPKGSYQTIADESNGDFDRKVMKVPGMEEALWFWTCTPTPLQLEEGRSIGLKTGVELVAQLAAALPGFHAYAGRRVDRQGRQPLQPRHADGRGLESADI